MITAQSLRQVQLSKHFAALATARANLDTALYEMACAAIDGRETKATLKAVEDAHNAIDQVLAHPLSSYWV